MEELWPCLRWKSELLSLYLHPYVTDLVKPNLVSYFSQLGEILANLGPGQFQEKTWSNFDEPGEKLSLPCDLRFSENASIDPRPHYRFHSVSDRPHQHAANPLWGRFSLDVWP